MNDLLSEKIAALCDMEIKTDNSGFWNFLWQVCFR